ncbi:hypothetical protein B9Z55_024488 [Caenorhabditis nigoni]|nr:hypothetical protein B9Z55_024488 [Caenorhabditis nigoni]
MLSPAIDVLASPEKKLNQSSRTGRSPKIQKKKTLSTIEHSEQEIMLCGTENQERKQKNRRHTQDSQSSGKAKKSKPAFMCCSESVDLSFSSSNLICNSGKEDCRIRPENHFWVPQTQNGEVQKGVCEACFDGMKDKEGWRKKKNTNKKKEEIFTCQRCSGLWHQCCSFFYGEPKKFVCRICAPESYKLVLDASGSSPDSNFIEERVNAFLENALERNQEFQKISVRAYYNPEDGVKTEELVPLSWKRKFIRKYGKMIKFASRAIHVFQQQDGVDQIFFSIFASEYRDPVGDGKSWVVIDCLDSVKIFQPTSLRTQIYQELILSYFHLARSMGFLDSYLWADPPVQGDDYVFNVKPANQLPPTPLILENWYLQVMEKGKSEGIIKEFRSFEKEKELKKYKKPTDVPMFQKSLWPPLMCGYDNVRKPQKLWKSISVEWDGHGSDNWFIEFNEVEQDEQLEGMIQERFHPILLSKEELLYRCLENNWQFNYPRRAKFASVGLINLM